MGEAGPGAEEKGRAASKGTQLRENWSQVLYHHPPPQAGPPTHKQACTHKRILHGALGCSSNPSLASLPHPLHLDTRVVRSSVVSAHPEGNREPSHPFTSREEAGGGPTPNRRASPALTVGYGVPAEIRSSLANSQATGAPCSQTGVQQGRGWDLGGHSCIAALSLPSSSAFSVVAIVAPFEG